jgi:hypothetical protein
MTKKYVIKQADSNYYHSGYLEWNPHIDVAIQFKTEGMAENAIEEENVTTEDEVYLVIIPIYVT